MINRLEGRKGVKVPLSLLRLKHLFMQVILTWVIYQDLWTALTRKTFHQLKVSYLACLPLSTLFLHRSHPA